MPEKEKEKEKGAGLKKKVPGLFFKR